MFLGPLSLHLVWVGLESPLTFSCPAAGGELGVSAIQGSSQSP